MSQPTLKNDTIAIEQRGRMINELAKIEVNTQSSGGGGAQTKTFSGKTDPSEAVPNGTTTTKQFVIAGGCDEVNANFDEINPIRVNTDGKVNMFATTGDITDLRNVSNGKSVAVLSNEINENYIVELYSR